MYLTPSERSALDDAARELGLSRSEVLRRGIVLAAGKQYVGELRELVDSGFITPAAQGPGEPPPAAPVARWRRLSAELDADREGR